MKQKDEGMTFIEVVVALFILASGILGAVAMQTAAKKGSFDAMQRSIASSLAQDILERIRSNSADNATLVLYEGTFGAAARAVPANRCNTAAANCSAAQMATNDLYEWSELLRGGDAKIAGVNAGGLVGAIGCVDITGQQVAVVISWEGRTETADGGSGDCGTKDNSRRQLSMTTFVF